MKTFDETFEYVLKKFYRIHGEKSPTRLRFKRNNMAGMFNELGYKTGAEIGVYKGEYSEILCRENPGLKLYCVDPWKVYEGGEHEPFSQDQKALDGFYGEAVKRLAPYNCKIVRKTSMEAAKDFEPGSLDFVYIDANHTFDSVVEDLDVWAKIVREGGIVSGHDYGHFKHRDRNLETKRAINEHVKKYNISMLFLVNRNYQTSWFFVKNDGKRYLQIHS